jgi:hypothetical protein
MYVVPLLKIMMLKSHVGVDYLVTRIIILQHLLYLFVYIIFIHYTCRSQIVLPQKSCAPMDKL